MVNLDYLYNPEAAKPFFNKNYFVDKKLGFQVIENGTILSHKLILEGKPKKYPGYGGIIDANGKFIVSSLIRYGEGSYYNPPPNQFNTAQIPLFTSAYFTVLGDTL